MELLSYSYLSYILYLCLYLWIYFYLQYKDSCREYNYCSLYLYNSGFPESISYTSSRSTLNTSSLN